MGQMDRDYWHRDRPFTAKKNEMSFLSKLILTIALLFIGALVYRYQTEILRLFQRPPAALPQRPVVRQPEPTVVAPRVLEPETARPESAGQIYRCGNSYSSAPCEGGGQIAKQSSAQVDGAVTKEIYLCKDIYDRLTWESVPCSANGRFMDRIARVPANASWDEQVAIARQQRDKAHAIAGEQVVPVASRPAGGKANAGGCQALDDRVSWLDSLGRIGGGGYTMDWIREERRKARDQQFRIGC